MKANELRIGNYVNYNGKDCVFGIYDIVNLHDDEDCADLTNPIPLTEEWLLKFGFIANKYNDEFTKGRYTLDCEYTDKGVYNFVIDMQTCIDVDIKHVHQLQNLYFALTGEELSII